MPRSTEPQIPALPTTTAYWSPPTNVTTTLPLYPTSTTTHNGAPSPSSSIPRAPATSPKSAAAPEGTLPATGAPTGALFYGALIVIAVGLLILVAKFIATRVEEVDNQ